MIHYFVSSISPTTIAFWVGVAGTVGSLLVMAIVETPTFPTGALCISLLFIHALGVGQSSLVAPYCLKHMSPLLYTLINSLHLVFLFIFQFTFLSAMQPGKGNWLEIGGAVLCVIGGLLAPLYQLIASYTKYSGKMTRTKSQEAQTIRTVPQ